MTEHNPRIILLGCGVNDTLQLTVEAQRILTRVGKVYALYLPPNLRRHLKSLRVQCIDLTERFGSGRSFSDIYLETADLILQRTTEEHPVILLTYGNPLFLNAVTRFLTQQARERNLSIDTHPGVSQLDAVICYLGLDVSTFGLQLFDAQRLVARKHQINPRVPLLILQAAGFAARQVVPSEPYEAKDYDPLASYLGEFYPPGQPVSLINILGARTQSTHITVSLDQFSELVPHIRAESSLFIDKVRQGQSISGQHQPT